MSYVYTYILHHRNQLKFSNFTLRLHDVKKKSLELIVIACIRLKEIV